MVVQSESQMPAVRVLARENATAGTPALQMN
jgi:hypothetical protein